MAQITVPVVMDHEYLDKAVKEAIEEVKKKFIPKYVIKDAISKIMQSDIPLSYEDEYERAAFADGQGEAVSILRECIKEFEKEQEAADENNNM